MIKKEDEENRENKIGQLTHGVAHLHLSLSLTPRSRFEKESGIISICGFSLGGRTRQFKSNLSNPEGK